MCEREVSATHEGMVAVFIPVAREAGQSLGRREVHGKRDAPFPTPVMTRPTQNWTPACEPLIAVTWMTTPMHMMTEVGERGVRESARRHGKGV